MEMIRSLGQKQGLEMMTTQAQMIDHQLLYHPHEKNGQPGEMTAAETIDMNTEDQI